MDINSEDLLSSSQEDDFRQQRKLEEENLIANQLLSSEHWSQADTDDEFAGIPIPTAAPASSSESRPLSSSLELKCDKNQPNFIATKHELDEQALKTYLYPVNYQIRDYQRNIVRKALQKNIICALPTGLGKTFIASVVMLNFYRWTKNAKIVFIAPTRPLVAQQVQSFLEISGISINETVALLQSVVNRENRAEVWKSKRVFFATAQTIENDLRKGVVEAESICLLVMDEAHRATGNHSYVNVVDLMKQKTTDFRILALTATPSGKLDGVQNVINNLMISGTEIRSEESLDIREYVHQREIEKIEVPESAEHAEIMKLVNSAIHDSVCLLKQAGIVSSTDILYLNSFIIQQQTQRYMAGPAARYNNGRKFQIQALSSLVHKVVYAVQLLKTHGLMPFYTRMHFLETDLMKSKGKNAQKLLQSGPFKQTMRRCRELIYTDDLGPSYSYKPSDRRLGFLSHPKIDILRHKIDEFLLSHGSDSRIIIFAEFRDSAAEIKWALETFNSETVRSTLFVGQASTGKSNIKGMTQKEQQSILNKFKSGEFNVLIATSIGEEGLDIGQVDLIICYDQSKSPIRNIQRMGRTGRKRNGSIIMLMTKNEANKLSMAFEGHKYIRDQIYDYSGTNSGPIQPAPFALNYHPANRMIPAEFEPQYEEITVVPPPENVEALATGDVLAALKQKPKRKAKQKPGKKKTATNVNNVNNEEYMSLGFTTAEKAFSNSSQP